MEYCIHSLGAEVYVGLETVGVITWRLCRVRWLPLTCTNKHPSPTNNLVSFPVKGAFKQVVLPPAFIEILFFKTYLYPKCSP